MVLETASARPARAPSMAQLGLHVLVAISLATALLMAAWLWTAWLQTREAYLTRMTTAAKLLAAQADHYFSSHAVRLKLLARDLGGLDSQSTPGTTLPLLHAFRANNPELLAVSLLRTDGSERVTAPASPAQQVSDALSGPPERAELEQALAATGLSVARVRRSRVGAQWVVPLWYAVRDRQGQVRSLIRAEVPIHYQQALWRDLGLPADTALGLWREDGYLINRLPDDPDGKIYSKPTTGGALHEAARLHPEGGSYTGRVVDGSYRFGVYQRLANQPLSAFLSLQRSTLVTAWWRQVYPPLLLVTGFLLACFIIYSYLARRYGARMRVIEARLAQAGGETRAALPTSGVHEIDTLVEALVRLQENLRLIAQNRERLLLQAAEAGTYTVRARDGQVLAADAALLKMLGRSEPEVVGQRWDGLVSIQTRTDPDVDPSLARRIAQVYVPGIDEMRWLALAEFQEPGVDGETIRHGLAFEVTDRERLLDRVNSQSLRLQALWELATTRGLSDSEKMQQMLRMALEALRMDAVLIQELCDRRLVVRAVVDDQSRFTAGQEMLLSNSLCQMAVANRDSVIIPDLRADPDLYRHAWAVELGLRAYAGLPILTGEALFGTLVFLRRAPLDKNFNTDDRAFMELLASWFGQNLLEEHQRQELKRLAMTDTLTRLINRRAAETRFAEEIARARRAKETFSIAICDLDRFKLINDHYGHEVGDQALLHVSGIMKAGLREGDWVARWGGEEFIIFLYGADGLSAHQAMERLRHAIKGNPVSSDHGPLEITTSIGIGTFHEDGDLASVLSEADGCLFDAKRAGRDNVMVSGSSHRGTLWRAGMLQHALLERRIVPAYQVIVDLRSGLPVADEALARLIEPDGRVVAAGEFVEAAEGINLIHIVDETIARQSMHRCATSLCNGTAEKEFAHFINLSPQFLARRELVQAMLHQAAQQCVDTGMVGKRENPVVLEITERQLLGNFDDLKRDLQPLLDFGFRLALDDFGSGYSSFLYLASLPISFLKIEGWMIKNMRGNPKVLAMVQSIIRLAHDQGIVTIAECVEDSVTADILRELGADWAQGWYFGRPECEVRPQQFLRGLRAGTN